MNTDKKKLIFLDVDGVLNSDTYWMSLDEEEKYSLRHLDRNAIKKLKRIVDKTGAEIVVSSTWRKFKEDMDVLSDSLYVYGLSVMSKTPVLYNKERGDEISAWFESHPDFKDAVYVILDDDADMNVHMDRLVKTDYRYGLTDSKAEKAIEMLNEEQGEHNAA